MSSVAKLLFYFQVLINGAFRELGDRNTPISITVGDPSFDQEKTIGTSTTWDVWEAGSEEPVSSFDLLLILPQADVILELTTDKAADVGTEVFTMKLLAGIPFILGSDVSYANYTADFGGGTLDVIDRIRIRNLSASATATVRVLMY